MREGEGVKMVNLSQLCISRKKPLPPKLAIMYKPQCVFTITWIKNYLELQKSIYNNYLHIKASNYFLLILLLCLIFKNQLFDLIIESNFRTPFFQKQQSFTVCKIYAIHNSKTVTKQFA